MIKTINGKIEGFEKSYGTNPRTGRAWTRYAFKINGNVYSTFDVKIGEKFKLGDSIVMVGEQGEKYFDMKTMNYAEGAKLSPQMDNSTLKPSQAPSETNEVIIDLLRQILVAVKGLK